MKMEKREDAEGDTLEARGDQIQTHGRWWPSIVSFLVTTERADTRPDEAGRFGDGK